jgi:hypothetical protein
VGYDLPLLEGAQETFGAPDIVRGGPSDLRENDGKEHVAV